MGLVVASIFVGSFVVWGFACYRIGYWQCHKDTLASHVLHERDRNDEVMQLIKRRW